MKGVEMVKVIVTFLLLVAAGTLAFVYLFPPEEYKPGVEVNQETFTHILEEAADVNIVMDIRDIEDPNDRWAVLQCGVDFAGSRGLVTKRVHYLSIDDDGCVAEDGRHPAEFCYSAMKGGLNLYIHKGTETTFHTDAMAVGVQHDYIVGLCNIEPIG
ncbi:MAG: hypothetical protein ABII71_00925 [Candidatus Micrarchaeota archaeon]